MEPKASNIATTGAGQTEGQSLSPDTATKPGTTKTGNRTTNQEIATGNTGKNPNQTTGCGRTKNG